MPRIILSIFVQFASSIALFFLGVLVLTMIGGARISLQPVFLISMPFSFILGLVLHKLFTVREYVAGFITQLFLIFIIVAAFWDGTITHVGGKDLFDRQFWSFIASWYIPAILCIFVPSAVAFVCAFLFKKYILNQRPNGA